MQKNHPLYRECDRLWSKCVKARANYRCQVGGCGRTATDAHHVISRHCASLRFDLRNGVALCRSHHDHSRPLDLIAQHIKVVGQEEVFRLCILSQKLATYRRADLVLIRDKLEKEKEKYEI